MQGVPLERFGPAEARLEEDAEVARIHHCVGARNLGEERGMKLLEVVPRYGGVDVMADVIVDVIPEEIVDPIADDRTRAEQLSLVPRRVVVFGDETDAIQKREDVDGN